MRPTILSEQTSEEYTTVDAAERLLASMNAFGDSSASSWYLKPALELAKRVMSFGFSGSEKKENQKQGQDIQRNSSSSKEYVKVTKIVEPRAIFNLDLLSLEAVPEIRKLFDNFAWVTLKPALLKPVAKQVMMQYGSHFCPNTLVGGKWTVE